MLHISDSNLTVVLTEKNDMHSNEVGLLFKSRFCATYFD